MPSGPARHLARVVEGCEKDSQQASVRGIGARQLGVVVGGAQVLRCQVSVEARRAIVFFNDIDVFRSRNRAQDAIRTGIYDKDFAGSGRRSPKRHEDLVILRVLNLLRQFSRCRVLRTNDKQTASDSECRDKGSAVCGIGCGKGVEACDIQLVRKLPSGLDGHVSHLSVRR